LRLRRYIETRVDRPADGYKTPRISSSPPIATKISRLSSKELILNNDGRAKTIDGYGLPLCCRSVNNILRVPQLFNTTVLYCL